MKNKTNHRIAALIMLTTFATASLAVTVNEADLGSGFSSDPTNPTMIDLDVGDNMISGTTDNFFTGADYFAFTLTDEQSISSITVSEFTVLSSTSFDPETSFFAIGDRRTFPPGFDPSDELTPDDVELLTASLIDEMDIPAPGEPGFNLLDPANRATEDEEMVSLRFDGNFNNILGPGSYWFWVSETEGETFWSLNISVDSTAPEPVPVPAPLFLMMGPLAGLLLFKRRSDAV